MADAPSTSVPTTRQRFRSAITAATTLDVAAGLCEAIHKAELREIVEELQESLTSNPEGTLDVLSQLINEYGL